MPFRSNSLPRAPISDEAAPPVKPPPWKLTNASAVVAKLKDSGARVRYAAVETLGKLGAAALAQHEQALATAANEDGSQDVRRAACLVMHRLKPSAGYDTVAKLEDLDGYPDADTRLEALKTLGKLDAATLAQHEQCLARVAGPGWEERVVREAAAQLLAELRGLGD